MITETLSVEHPLLESKASLTKRLRDAGQWEAACKFRDAARQRLRASGTRRAEAVEIAWAEMAAAFPPLTVKATPEPEPVEEAGKEEAVEVGDGLERQAAQDGETPEEESERLQAATLRTADEWAARNGVLLSDDARQDLAGKLADCWFAGSWYGK